MTIIAKLATLTPTFLVAWASSLRENDFCLIQTLQPQEKTAYQCSKLNFFPGRLVATRTGKKVARHKILVAKKCFFPY